MKKIILLFFLMLTSSVVLAEDDTTSVELNGESVHGHNRNEIVLPVVTYSSNLNTLTVEFESEESYVLEIEDANGVIWYSAPLNTSGAPTVYYVNLQSQNSYIITITSANYYFYGHLEL